MRQAGALSAAALRADPLRGAGGWAALGRLPGRPREPSLLRALCPLHAATRDPSAPGCLPPVPCSHSHAARPWPPRGLSPPLRLLVLPPSPRPCHPAATQPTCLQKPRGYGVEVGFLPPSPTPCPSPAPHRCHCQTPHDPPHLGLPILAPPLTVVPPKSTQGPLSLSCLLQEAFPGSS